MNKEMLELLCAEGEPGAKESAIAVGYIVALAPDGRR